MTIQYAGVSFWHDYNRSGILTLRLKWQGYHGIIAQWTPYKSHNARRTWFVWFLTSSCNGSIAWGYSPKYKHARRLRLRQWQNCTIWNYYGKRQIYLSFQSMGVMALWTTENRNDSAEIGMVGSSDTRTHTHIHTHTHTHTHTYIYIYIYIYIWLAGGIMIC